MSLTLFRSTAFGHSDLAPGEMRTHRHPGWVVAAVALWIGLACNPALWRIVACACTTDLPRALGVGLGMAAAVGLVLSVVGSRRMIKPAAVLLLLLAAVLAAGLWSQGHPVDGSLLRNPGPLLASATLWRDWRFDALAAALALIPIAWLLPQRLRRLTPARRWSFGFWGALLSAGLLGTAAALF